jgi:hypothetical protein
MMYVEMDAKGKCTMCITPRISTSALWPQTNPASAHCSPARSASGSPANWNRKLKAMRSPRRARASGRGTQGRKLELISKTEAAVKDRLTKEITYWDHRAEELKLQEQAGKPNAKLNSGEARKRADLLQGRLQKRLEDLRLEAQMSPLPPVVLGGLLVVPIGLLSTLNPAAAEGPEESLQCRLCLTRRHPGRAARARAVIMDIERSLGFEPTDRELEKLGYDIESRVPGSGKLRFIEVKGRVSGAPTITVTRNEILYSLNKPDDFILAIVEFLDDENHRVHYLRQPFNREPDFGVTSVNYDLAELVARAEAPQ